MSSKILALYFLLFVIVVVLLFSHFVDIPTKKEGFDLLSQINRNSSKPDSENDQDIDVLLTPSSAPGMSPSSDNNLPPNYGVPTTSSPKVESFQVRKENPETIKRFTKKTDSTHVFNHIFSDQNTGFQLKTI